jgi:hypothetical protein
MMTAAGDMLALVDMPGRSRSGRPEFGRVYLRSLIASAEERVDLHRSRGQRVRLWIATRRLRKLLAYENTRHVRIGSAAAAPPRLAVAVVSTAWLASIGLFGLLRLEHAGAFWVSVGEVPMLLLCVAWFFLAIACVPTEGTSLE